MNRNSRIIELIPNYESYEVIHFTVVGFRVNVSVLGKDATSQIYLNTITDSNVVTVVA